MNSKVEKLKNSRVKVSVKAQAADLQHAAEHAFHHATAQVAVKGFRPGKAPKHLLIQATGKGRILSELVDHALPELLEQVAEKEDLHFIEAPRYELEKLCELNDDGALAADTTLEFTAEGDVSPKMTVGDYAKIKIKPTKVEEVTDKHVNEVLDQLADRRATYEVVDRAAKKDDKLEIDFQGKRNGIPEERLASKNHPLTLGSGVMIPGFEDELMGKKAGDTHTFEITFPKDYHAKDLASQKVVFEVKVNTVSQKKLPVIDDAFAKEFGHDKLDELKVAIKQEREFAFADKAKQEDQEATLEAFLPLVKGDLPESLVDRELDRQMETLRKQTQMYGMSFDHYLEHLKKTEEDLRGDMRDSAEKAVRIGLGLSEVVEKENLPKDKEAGYHAIERLVEIATGSTGTSKIKK